MDTLTYLRQFRIGGLAIFDLIVSYIGIYLLAPLLSKIMSIFRLSISRHQWLWLTLPLGTVVHILVGQQTTLTKMVFNANNYLAIIGLIFMTYMGLKDVRVKKSKRK